MHWFPPRVVAIALLVSNYCLIVQWVLTILAFYSWIALDILFIVLVILSLLRAYGVCFVVYEPFRCYHTRDMLIILNKTTYSDLMEMSLHGPNAYKRSGVYLLREPKLLSFGPIFVYDRIDFFWILYYVPSSIGLSLGLVEYVWTFRVRL